MSNILETAVRDNEYLGMTKIDLNSLWPGLNVDTYVMYRNMHTWLKESGVGYKFFWYDTGKFLPDAVYIESKSDTATYFMLKYRTCK